MIARAVQLDMCQLDSPQGVRQRSPCGIKHGQMIKPGRSGRRLRTSGTFPCIESDVVVVAARRNERSTASISLGELETKNSAVEAESSFKVSHFEMDMADAHAGIDGRNYCA